LGKGSFNPFATIRDLQERLQFLMSADRQIAEVVEVLRDTHRILAKLEGVVDRLDGTMTDAQSKFEDFDVGRVERMESAVLNIERATLSLEAAMGALPKRWIKRIERSRTSEEEKPV
jgi:t-SNARE complex subunit (syntaxin)